MPPTMKGAPAPLLRKSTSKAITIWKEGQGAGFTYDCLTDLTEEQQEASLNPIDITLQDLQKWRDTHEKRVAEMRMEAAIEAEEAQQVRNEMKH